MHHSLPLLTMNPSALCIALRHSDIESPADLPSKCLTIGMKNTSPLNIVSSGCSNVYGVASIADMTSFLIPFAASQSGSTDQWDLSVVVHFRLCHILLRPSATGFSISGLCRMLMMLWLRIDCIHQLWWVLSLSLRRQS